MAYIDLLNKFNLKLNNFYQKENHNKLPFFNELMLEIEKSYSLTTDICQMHHQRLNEYNSQISSLINQHKEYIDEQSSSLMKELEEFDRVYNYRVDYVNNILNESAMRISEENKSYENKKYVIKSHSRDTINSLDINRNLRNNQSINRIPSYNENYNATTILLTNARTEETNKYHAQKSRILYNIKNDIKEKIDKKELEISVLEKILNENKQDIFELNGKTDREILNLQIEYNKNLKKTSTDYKEMGLAYASEAYDDKQELIAIKNKKHTEYLKKNQEIINKISSEIKRLNDDLEVQTDYFETSKNKILSEFGLLLFKLERNYNHAYMDFKAAKSRTEIKSCKAKMNYYQKQYNYQKRLMNTKIEKNRLDYLIYKEKYNSNILQCELNKWKESVNYEEQAKLDGYLFKLNADYQALKRESDSKITYIRLDIESNRLRKELDLALLKHKLDLNVKLTEINKDIAAIDEQIKLAKLDIEYLQSLDEIESSRILNLEDANERLLNQINLMSIEMNKYLARFNEDSMKHRIDLNNARFNYFIRNEELLCEKEIKIVDEKIKLNENQLVFNRKYNKAQRDNYLLDKKNQSNIINANYSYNIEQNQFNLQINKLNLDTSFMEEILQTYNKIYSLHLQVFLNAQKEIFDLINQSNSNFSELFSVYTSIKTLFMDYFIEHLVEQEKAVEKIIDSQIHFEYGSKYEGQINDINNQADNECEQLNSRKNNINQTINNYKNIIHKWFMDINLCNIKREKALKNENFNVAKKLAVEINNTERLIKKNNHLISELNRALRSIDRRCEKIEQWREKNIKLLNNKRESDAASSYLLLENIKTIISNQIERFNIITIDNQPTDLKQFIKDGKLFISVISKEYHSMEKRISAKIKNFYHQSSEKLKRRKTVRYNQYKYQQLITDLKIKRDLKAFEHEEHNLKLELSQINTSYLNNKHNIIHKYLENLTNSANVYNNDRITFKSKYARLRASFFATVGACDRNIDKIKAETISKKHHINQKYQQSLRTLNKHYRLKNDEIHSQLVSTMNNLKNLGLRLPIDYKNDEQKINQKFTNISDKSNLDIKRIQDRLKHSTKENQTKYADMSHRIDNNIKKNNIEYELKLKDLKVKLNRAIEAIK